MVTDTNVRSHALPSNISSHNFLLDLQTALRGLLVLGLTADLDCPLVLSRSASCFRSARVWAPGLLIVSNNGVDHGSLRLQPGVGGLGTCTVDALLGVPSREAPVPQISSSLKAFLLALPLDVDAGSNVKKLVWQSVVVGADFVCCLNGFSPVGFDPRLSRLTFSTTLLSISKEASAVSSATTRNMVSICFWFRAIVGWPLSKQIGDVAVKHWRISSGLLIGQWCSLSLDGRAPASENSSELTEKCRTGAVSAPAKVDLAYRELPAFFTYWRLVKLTVGRLTGRATGWGVFLWGRKLEFLMDIRKIISFTFSAIRRMIVNVCARQQTWKGNRTPWDSRILHCTRARDDRFGLRENDQLFTLTLFARISRRLCWKVFLWRPHYFKFSGYICDATLIGSAATEWKPISSQYFSQ